MKLFLNMFLSKRKSKIMPKANPFKNVFRTSDPALKAFT